MAIYCYEITKRIGAYAAALGGLDALVFSGGIGEHAPVGARQDLRRPRRFSASSSTSGATPRNAPVISTPASRVAVHVIPTDEEVVIAQAGLPRFCD